MLRFARNGLAVRMSSGLTERWLRKSASISQAKLYMSSDAVAATIPTKATKPAPVLSTREPVYSVTSGAGSEIEAH